MSIINQYKDNENQYKIDLSSNEIYLDIDENIKMKLKSSLTKVDLHRYPNNNMTEIKKQYAKYAGVKEENIIVGNGSDEALNIVISAKVKEGKKVLSLNPDFVMYDFYVTRFGGQLIKYDINPLENFDVNKFISFGKENDIDMIIFSNPNNPTGMSMSIEEIIEVLEAFKDKTVVIDEAYYEFNGDTVMQFIDKYNNLYVTRTLSKAWGLAALRIGFLISSEKNINEMYKYKVPYTVSSYSQYLSEIILRYPDRVIENTKKVVDEREKLYKELTYISKNAAMQIEFYPSKGNFIFGRTKHKEALEKGLKSNGILIRYFEGDGFRITVGSPMENRKITEAIKNIFGCD